MRTKNPSKTMIMVAAAAIFGGLLIEIIRNPPTETPLESLVAYVNAHGTPLHMPSGLVSFFGIAGDNIVFTHCSVTEDARIRTIGIRRRIDFGRTDIVLVDLLPSGPKEYFLTTLEGKLLMSCDYDSKL